MCIAAAIAGGIGAIGSIGSAVIGSSSASDAANAQIASTQAADQTQLAMYNQTQANLQPYMNSGTNALQTLMQGLGLQSGSSGGVANGQLTAPFNYQQSPAYQYEVGQNMQAVQNSAAAHGGLVSGNALTALQQNAQGLASTDYYNQANLYSSQQNQLFNMLQTLAGSGQNAAAHLGSLGSNTANAISSNQISAGNSAAASSVAQGQTLSNLLNNQSFLGGVSSLFGGSSDPFASAVTQGTAALNSIPNYNPLMT